MFLAQASLSLEVGEAAVVFCGLAVNPCHCNENTDGFTADMKIGHGNDLQLRKRRIIQRHHFFVFLVCLPECFWGRHISIITCHAL